jgi:hypothetical protein
MGPPAAERGALTFGVRATPAGPDSVCGHDCWPTQDWETFLSNR